MAERLIAPVLKTGLPARVAGVRIPLLPLIFARKFSSLLDLPLGSMRGLTSVSSFTNSQTNWDLAIRDIKANQKSILA
jgi:hypothetical protein